MKDEVSDDDANAIAIKVGQLIAVLQPDLCGQNLVINGPFPVFHTDCSKTGFDQLCRTDRYKWFIEDGDGEDTIGECETINNKVDMVSLSRLAKLVVECIKWVEVERPGAEIGICWMPWYNLIYVCLPETKEVVRAVTFNKSPAAYQILCSSELELSLNEVRDMSNYHLTGQYERENGLNKHDRH